MISCSWSSTWANGGCDETSLPLPLGANAIRKDLGPTCIRDVNRLLHASIRYGLEHRDAALAYALGFGRGLDHAKADTFVGHVRQRLDARFWPARTTGGRRIARARIPGGCHSATGRAGIRELTPGVAFATLKTEHGTLKH